MIRCTCGGKAVIDKANHKSYIGGSDGNQRIYATLWHCDTCGAEWEYHGPRVESAVSDNTYNAIEQLNLL